MKSELTLKGLIANKMMNTIDMDLFKSHKEVHAMPMKAGYFEREAGIQLRGDHEADDDGYLVVYDRGTPGEYVSWSPKDKFDNGYFKLARKKINKVSLGHIQSLIDSLEFKFERVGDSNVTGCWAFLPNEYKVGYGESIAFLTEEFDEQIGKDSAKERCIANARQNLFEFEGYLLKVTGRTSNFYVPNILAIDVNVDAKSLDSVESLIKLLGKYQEALPEELKKALSEWNVDEPDQAESLPEE